MREALDVGRDSVPTPAEPVVPAEPEPEASNAPPVLPGTGVGARGVSRVRFQILFGAASVRPYRMARPTTVPDALGPSATLRAGEPEAGGGDWYGWRLMGANNRELGRSAVSFASYPLAGQAVRHLQRHAERLVRRTLVDPATGRWSWRLDLDDEPVAVSSRWYERDHDGRLGMAKFVELTPDAEIVDGIVTVYDRRGIGATRIAFGAMQ